MIEEPPPPPPITPGVARALSPLVRRIACEGEDGGPALNTYLVGIDEIVIIDPGPGAAEHVDVLCGCGGDRIRWIVMTNPDEAYSGAALKLKECTGAELVAPAGFEGADAVLEDGFQFEATEFRITAFSVGGDNHVLVLEQERTLISGDHLEDEIPSGLPARLKRFRLKSIAPGHGQYIDDAKSVLNK